MKQSKLIAAIETCSDGATDPDHGLYQSLGYAAHGLELIKSAENHTFDVEPQLAPHQLDAYSNVLQLVHGALTKGHDRVLELQSQNLQATLARNQQSVPRGGHI